MVPRIVGIQGKAVTLSVMTSSDILKARKSGRMMAKKLGFPMPRAMFISTVITELSDNMIIYAGGGEIILDTYVQGTRTGLSITARDEGPGIANINQALKGSTSASSNFGCGLPGLRALADVFNLESDMGKGTTVQIVLWPT